MIEQAEKDGKLQPGGRIIDAAAGNTGIGLLHIANERGYKCLFTCPDHVSKEKIDYLELLGAEIKMCPVVGGDDPRNFKNAAKTLAEETGAFYADQFSNLNNFRAHYETTGPEIWQQTEGKIDSFVCSTGTGGSISGIGTYLKEHNSKVRIYMAVCGGTGVVGEKDPLSNLYSLREMSKEEKKASVDSTVLEGIGSSNLNKVLSQASGKLDGFINCPDLLGLKMAHFLLQRDGLFVGGSAALNVVAAYIVAKRLGPGHTIVTLLCDGGARYISKVFNPEWLKEKQFDLGDLSNLDFLSEAGTLAHIF